MKALLLSGSGDAPPPAWEYQIYEPRRGSTKEIIAAHLSDLGSAGWDLVSVLPASVLFSAEMGGGLQAPAQAHFILKRSAPPEVEERPSFNARVGMVIAATLGEGALRKLRGISQALKGRAYGTSNSTV